LTDSFDAGRELLRTEMGTRIREALILRDWHRLAHWARQWIQTEPRNPSGFKWLARAAMGLGKIQKAAYAYGRLLDFDPANEEARKFFSEYPSSLRDQSTEIKKIKKPEVAPQGPDSLKEQTLSPEQRKTLATRLLEVADLHFQMELYARAARLYRESFDWQPSQTAALGTARCLHKAQKSPEAMQFLMKQLQQFRSWIEGRLLLGRILFETGQVKQAQREWQEALKIDPQNKEALDFLRALIKQPTY